MKLRSILESPLPDKWETSKFAHGPTGPDYDDMVQYAITRSKRLARGSSRVALEIRYGKRPTVLKVALNEKGLAQNTLESKVFSDPEFRDLVVPIIDYDTANPRPSWLHVEKVKKVTNRSFETKTGLTLGKFVHELTSAELGHKSKNQFINSILKLVNKYDLILGDFANISNWGEYDDRLVIIDAGTSNEVFDMHYAYRV